MDVLTCTKFSDVSVSTESLAQHYKLSIDSIDKIFNGKTLPHVTQPNPDMLDSSPGHVNPPPIDEDVIKHAHDDGLSGNKYPINLSVCVVFSNITALICINAADRTVSSLHASCTRH